MAFIPVPNTAYLVLKYLSPSGKTFTNGFAFFKSGGWDEASLGLLTGEVGDAWTESVQDVVSEFIDLVGCDAVDLTDVAGAYNNNPFETPIPGTRTGAIPPLHSTMSVTLRTASRGRSFRGRIYHSGLGISDQAGDRTWSSAVAAEVSAAYQTFVSALETAATAQFSVISRYEDGVARTFGLHTEVTAIQARTPVATQRKRVSTAG